MNQVKKPLLYYFQRSWPVISWILLLTLTYFPCFLQLAREPIRIWDEARLAINAAEIYRNGWSWVTTFENVPDLWNTKPPLLIWLQVACMKIWGLNELSVRLPTAIAGFLTSIFVFRFTKKNPGKQTAWASLLVLLGTSEYFGFHIVRTGDYDALLVLFTTIYSLLYYKCLQKENFSRIMLLIAFLIVLAIWTKGVAGLLLLPGLFIWTVLQSRLKSLLVHRYFWYSVAIVLSGTALYYITRELILPGYLQAVWNNELGGRFANALEGHGRPFYFYISQYFDFKNYYIWIYFTIAGILFSLKDKSKTGDLIRFLSLQTFSFLLIISIAQTKIEWYKAPVYPFLAIISGYSIIQILRWLNTFFRLNTFSSYCFNILFVLGISIYPYSKNVHFAYDYILPEWEREFYEGAIFLQQSIKNGQSLDGYKVALFGYNPDLPPEVFGSMRDNGKAVEYYYPEILFYIYAAEEKGWKLNRSGISALKPGDKVISGTRKMQELIIQKFHYQSIQINEFVQIYSLGNHQ